MSTTGRITPQQAKAMRDALLADPVANRELFDANHPGHKIRLEEWKALGDIQNGEFKNPEASNG
jgi:hypothetical protein